VSYEPYAAERRTKAIAIKDDLEPARGAVISTLLGIWLWGLSLLIANWIFL
jgi:hypothetical protein